VIFKGKAKLIFGLFLIYWYLEICMCLCFI